MKILRMFDSLKLVLATVACIFAFTPANAATLPAGYTELEYIESTGTQYIDTGLTGFNTGDWEIYVKWMSTNATQNTYAYIAGVYKSESHNAYRVIAFSQAGYRYWVSGNSKAGGGSVSVDGAINEIHEATIKNGSVVFDGTIYETPTKGTVLPSDSSLYVFGRSKTSGAKARIYSVKATKDGVVQAEFIPAQNSSGVVGLYDTKRNTFYTNSDTEQDAIGFVAGPAVPIKIATTHYNETKFAPVETRLDAAVAAVDTVVTQTMTQAQQIDQIATNKQTRPDEGCPAKYCLLVEDEQGVPHWYPIAGANGVAHNLPAGYTELQYISTETVGGPYIDTGLTAGSNTRVLARYKLVNLLFASPISVRNVASAGDGFGVGLNGSQQFISDYNGDRKVFTTITPNTTDIITVDKNKNVCTITIGEQTETVTNTASTFTTTNTLPLFAQNTNGSVSPGKYAFYSFKMWEGDTLVRDMVPAKYGNTVGMYDLADSNPATAFHTNAGTGEFVAGPDM